MAKQTVEVAALPAPAVHSTAAESDSDRIGKLLERMGKVAGDHTTEIIQIASNPKLTCEEKVDAIYKIDGRTIGWSAPHWGKVVGFSRQMVEKTNFWKVERKKHAADAIAKFRDLNPDGDLPEELRQFKEDAA